MDPKATIVNLLCALYAQDRDEIVEMCDALSGWVGNDGFIPDSDTLDDILAETLEGSV